MLRRFKMSVMVLALVDVLKRGNELRLSSYAYWRCSATKSVKLVNLLYARF